MCRGTYVPLLFPSNQTNKILPFSHIAPKTCTRLSHNTFINTNNTQLTPKLIVLIQKNTSSTPISRKIIYSIPKHKFLLHYTLISITSKILFDDRINILQKLIDSLFISIIVSICHKRLVIANGNIWDVMWQLL